MNIQQLRTQLEDPDLHVRLRAASDLAEAGSLAGRPVLLDALTHEEPWAREKAAGILGTIGAAWTIAPLASRLSDPFFEVRREAILGLGRTHDIAAVPFLIQALSDEDPERREDAVVALDDVLGREIYEQLDLEEDEDGSQARADAEAWWRDNAHRFDPNIRYDRGEPTSIARWIAELRTQSPEVVEMIVMRLEDWTGERLGGEGQDEIASRWEAWWRDNEARFPPGRRYFYGHDVEKMPLDADPSMTAGTSGKA